MNLFLTMDIKEILDRLDKEVLKNYIKEKWSLEERNEIGEESRIKDSDSIWEALEFQLEEEQKGISVFIADRVETKELLRKISEDDVVEYIREETQYYIGDEVSELIEQIKNSGCIEEVSELFTLRYTG